MTGPLTDDRVRELATMPYRDYLLTPEWQERRQEALARAGYRCQVCNGRERLEVHHRTYERRGHEEPGDLTVLDEDCHELYHGAGRLAEPAPGARPPLALTAPAAYWQAPPPAGAFYHRPPPWRLARRLRQTWRRAPRRIRVAMVLFLAAATMLLADAALTALAHRNAA